MTQIDIPKWALEPFNVGRSTFRLFFDFGVMLSCFSSSPNKRVLDFGAGTGWLSEFLARMGYEVYAIDVDADVMPSSIRLRVLADHRLNLKSITPVIGSGMDLPFPNGFFSHVCCFDTLHHMNDYPKTFREISRVLAPDGRAVFIEPGARHSRSEETIAFIETYKKDDPTWIERDVALDEIAQISKESGFSNMVVLPTLLPGLKSYTVSQWTKFRGGDSTLAIDYINLLKDFNYNDHLSFYCEKTSPLGEEKQLDFETSNDTIAGLFGKKIAIDLTPMLPGGENGGAKWMTLELLNALASLLPETSFVLLTAESSHSELDWLENEHSNIKRLCVLRNSPPIDSPTVVPASATTGRDKILVGLKTLAGHILPPALKQGLKTMPSAFSALRHKVLNQIKAVLPLALRQQIKRLLAAVKPASSVESLIGQIGTDLLFCPFTAPFYADPRIPAVSVIYDLQYRAYPQFFTPEELAQREENFRIAYQKAGCLVAISEFVRQTVIETAKVPPERVIAVPIGLLRPPKQIDHETLANGLLEKNGLCPGEYILYPANFWLHKNHAMLLTAFNMYQQANPGSTLKLVCTGTPGFRAEAFCQEVRRMGLADWVIYPGYVSTEEYDVLLRSAFAMVFPSLYEGFGIPVLEAMAAGVPVLCSKVTSLPEVGGDAVLYFDPRRPRQIVEVLTRLLEEPGLQESQIRKGLYRAALFEGADRMALNYADVFVKALLPQANSRLATEK
jgi:glycosyltransferase involved in cell wall biosynthesis/SAM-dependent methyltransferase